MATLKAIWSLISAFLFACICAIVAGSATHDGGMTGFAFVGGGILALAAILHDAYA